MRRATLAFAAVLVFAAVDVVACNSISGVGDFSFTSASSTTGSGGSAGSTESAGGTAGGAATGGSGGTGGAGLEVACVKVECPVVPGALACCYDNKTLFTESGRCVSGPPDMDGCTAADKDAGRETRIECSGPADCENGDLCCATYGGTNADAGTGWYTIVACAKSCDPPDQRVVCDANVDGGDCPKNGDAAALSCQQSQLLPTGYFTCK